MSSNVDIVVTYLALLRISPPLVGKSAKLNIPSPSETVL
jgi:hypothetical protein